MVTYKRAKDRSRENGQGIMNWEYFQVCKGHFIYYLFMYLIAEYFGNIAYCFYGYLVKKSVVFFCILDVDDFYSRSPWIHLDC